MSQEQGWQEYVILMDGQESGVERTKKMAQWKANQLRAGLRYPAGRVRIKKRRVGFVASNSSRRKNPTKAQKREKAHKASVKRRVAVALAKFLKQANPAMKTAGATVTRLKGGGFTIRPIKANAGGLKRVLSEYGHQRRGGTPRLAAVRRAVRSTRKNPKRNR